MGIARPRRYSMPPGRCTSSLMLGIFCFLFEEMPSIIVNRHFFLWDVYGHVSQFSFPAIPLGLLCQVIDGISVHCICSPNRDDEI